MGILIMSDTHGLVREVKQVVSRHDAEKIFHCGDFCTNHKNEPFSRMLLVEGNCDTAGNVPKERETVWRDLRIYQTHGHLYGVKSSLMRLQYRADEVGSNLVLFGHSHVPVCAVEHGVLFINPGSLQLPRGFRTPTYAYLQQTDATADNVGVTVQFFDYRGEPVKELGGSYTIRRSS